MASPPSGSPLLCLNRSALILIWASGSGSRRRNTSLYPNLAREVGPAAVAGSLHVGVGVFLKGPAQQMKDNIRTLSFCN